MDYNIIDNGKCVYTGNLNNLKIECKEKIRYLKNTDYKNKLFYIGATSNYNDRMLQHYNEKNMTTMFVLSQLPTKYKTESVEKELIKVFGKLKLNYNNYINNEPQTGGGEGLINGTNYVYITFGNKPNKN